MKPRPSPFGLVLTLTSLVFPSSAFNLEPRGSVVLNDPTTSRSRPGDRESYFGFAVALHHLASERRTWLVVGAPRANSTFYRPQQITEPGCIFKCDVGSSECEELVIDKTGNTESPFQTNEFRYQDLKNGGWLGGALDSQPTHTDRQTVAVCAPRWKNQLYINTYLMNGACYWLNSSLPNAPAHKKIPLVQYSKQTYRIRDRSLFYYSHGGAGLSMHFPEDSTELLVGAPGVFNWQGSVIRFRDAGAPPSGNISRRRRRRQSRVSEHQMFASQTVPNPYHTPSIKDFDLFGYSVTSGRFTSRDEILYAGGATRGANSNGKVIVFSFPYIDEESLEVHYEWTGRQIGENFGASLVAMDVNGDGFSDLVVGAPMYSSSEGVDMGRIAVYQSLSLDQFEAILQYSEDLFGLGKPHARFGTTLAACGDLNRDGFQDVAVGAPWEDGQGAVYIYLGSPTGLRKRFSQHLQPRHFQQPFKGFGMAISRGVDIDGNHYPDLAIGSFMSGHATVVRSRPVANIRASVSTSPSTIALNASSLELTACLDYSGYKVPRATGVKGNITLDFEYFPTRAYFADSNSFVKAFEATVVVGNRKCQTYDVKLKADKIDPRKPILIKVDWELDQDQASNLVVQPLTDPNAPHSARERVGIITGCEADGDKTCRIDMRVETTLPNQAAGFVIGSASKPSVSVSVFNLGEPVFLPNVTVSVDPPLALNLPVTRVCDYPSKDNRSFVWCRLKNPIEADQEDEVTFTIDMSDLNERASSSAIRVEVAGEGVEARPQDNSFAETLTLGAQASVKLHGSSVEEQIIYQRIEEDKINVTTAPEFIHFFSIRKEGPTPLSEVELVVDIPVNITSRGKTETFVNLYYPQTNFNGQVYVCNIKGATFLLDKEENGDSSIVPDLIAGNLTDETAGNLANRQQQNTGSQQQQNQQQQDQQQSTSISSRGTSKEVISLNCSNPLVSCARLTCSIQSWPGWTSFAELSIKMTLNLTVLAGHISAQGGAVMNSHARASIASLNPDLTFVGNKYYNFFRVLKVMKRQEAI